MIEALRQRYPGVMGWMLSVAVYAVLFLALLICLGAPEAPFTYGEL